MIELTPDHIFEGNKEFYINFDKGVMIGVEGCKPGNEPVTGRQFWTFKTLTPERPGKTLQITNIKLCAHLEDSYELHIHIVCIPSVFSMYYTGEIECAKCTTPIIVGVIIGIIGVLVGLSGLIITYVTAKKR